MRQTSRTRLREPHGPRSHPPSAPRTLLPRPVRPAPPAAFRCEPHTGARLVPPLGYGFRRPEWTLNHLTDRSPDRASLRLSWHRAPGAAVRHYELYRLLPGGDRRFLGGTCGTALYLPDVVRARPERAAVFEVRAVDELYARSAPARAALSWVP